LSNITDFMDEKMLELFFADTNEMLETSIDDILEIENGYNRELLDNIMRTMHSIKGGSAMLELKDIEYFSHNLEDYFIKLRDRVLEINVEWIDDLIDGVNTLKKWIENREKFFKAKQDFH
jgi:two-component system, chemotaxis family, sensor kinase CheA